MKNITPKQLDFLAEYFLGIVPDEGWLIRHTRIATDPGTHSMTITVDNMNEEDFKELESLR